MAARLTDGVRELIRGKNFGHLSTIMSDGSPQVSTVWVDLEGDYVLVNTNEGRSKPRNVRRDPRVAIAIAESGNEYNAVFIRGRVIEIRPDADKAHIDRMSQKYTGRERYGGEGDERIVFLIEPESVVTYGRLRREELAAQQ